MNIDQEIGQRAMEEFRMCDLAYVNLLREKVRQLEAEQKRIATFGTTSIARLVPCHAVAVTGTAAATRCANLRVLGSLTLRGIDQRVTVYTPVEPEISSQKRAAIRGSAYRLDNVLLRRAISVPARRANFRFMQRSISGAPNSLKNQSADRLPSCGTRGP
jgi:hypothetical protein